MILEMSDAVASICAQLRVKGIAIPRENEWLNGCIECFESNHPQYTQKELFDFVFDQWTLADLNDVAAASLPPSCKSCTKMMLTGKYAVQFNYMLDVSVPLHKQLQKIRRPHAQKNLDVDIERQEQRDKFNEVSASRSLKIEITDGFTTVCGFECSPIPAIKNSIPGEKAVLTGPIEVRKGVLLLKSSNVELLGGEVDTLLIPNATENVIARALNLEENPDPYSVGKVQGSVAVVKSSVVDVLDDGEDEALASLAEAVENESFTSQEPVVAVQQSYSRPQSTISSNVVTSRRPVENSRTKNVPKNSKQASITSFLSQPKKTAWSEFSDEIDEDFELAAAASLAEMDVSSRIPSHNPDRLKRELEQSYRVDVPKPREPAQSYRVDVPKPRETEPPYRVEAPKPQIPTSGPNKRKVELDIFGREKIPRSESSSSSTSESYVNPRASADQQDKPDDEKVYDWLPPPLKPNLEHVRPSHEKGKILIDYNDPSTLDLGSIPKAIRPETTQKPQSCVPSLNETYPPKTFPSSRTVAGKVVKVINKLQLQDAKWVLSAVVEARGVQLEMDFSPEALDKIFTVTAAEITRQKSEFKTNPQLKEKFNGHLRESQRRIQVLNCQMTIHFKNFISNPVVTDVSQN